MPHPSVQNISSGISGQHDPDHDPWTQHQRDFADIGVNNRSDYKNHIEKTMNDKNTTVLEANNDATIYYNKESNTAVVHDPNRADQGTCFRPPPGSEYLEKKEAGLPSRLGHDPLKVEAPQGGHDNFYNAKEARDSKNATSGQASAQSPSTPQEPPEPTKPGASQPASATPKEPQPDWKAEFRQRNEQSKIPDPPPPPPPETQNQSKGRGR
jgi:hypothetical protein